jgi:hypothetical protein
MADNKKQFSPKPSAIAEEVESSLPKEFHEAFARVVKAGMKVIFSKETHDDIVAMLSKGEGDIGKLLGEQIAGLMALLYKKSNQTIPGEVIIPAGTYLLAQGAEFLEQVTGEEMQPEETAIAMQVMIDTLMAAFGIDPNKFYSATEQALAKYEGAK